MFQNRAALKMAEMDAMFDRLFTSPPQIRGQRRVVQDSLAHGFTRQTYMFLPVDSVTAAFILWGYLCRSWWVFRVHADGQLTVLEGQVL